MPSCSSVWQQLPASSSFFFSSRRRHTRLQGYWSSDVCSSDLTGRARHEHPFTVDDGARVTDLCFERRTRAVEFTCHVESAELFPGSEGARVTAKKDFKKDRKSVVLGKECRSRGEADNAKEIMD